jgi:putative transposase
VLLFTVETERRQRTLTDAAVRAALRAAIIAVLRVHPFFIAGWVLPPDHWHTLCTLPQDDADYATRCSAIKPRVTTAVDGRNFRAQWHTARRAAQRHGTLWQHRYGAHCLSGDADFATHPDYLHSPPVKHGLVTRGADWPYSTCHRWVEAG